jgi:ribosomal protein L40E
MSELQLAGHYGRTVAVDLCEGCDLLWFDDLETANLSGPGLLALISAMAQAQTLPHHPLSPEIACPRCNGPVRRGHNRSRWGRSMQLACVRRHGAYQSFAQFLAEKGLARPMAPADRARLMKRDGTISCINCGAGLDADAERCRWCESVPSLIDIARLANALDPEGATASHEVHSTVARTSALGCLACGSAVPRETCWSCPQCGATLVAAGLAEAHRRIAALGPALESHARKPAPAIVERRLQEQAAGLRRQRDWAAEMQAEADAGKGRLSSEAWKLPEIPLRRQIGWLLFALALFSLWHWW